MPGADFWGPERTQGGKHITVLYFQRDADVIEPLVPQMDGLVGRLCNPLPCPSQVSVLFENSVSSRRVPFTVGEMATVRLPSPHLLALPTDTISRGELYRALETQLVRALVTRAFGWGGYRNRQASQDIVRWELARVGLAPAITGATRDALAARLAGAPQPLESISLRSNAVRMGMSDDPTTLLALTFLDQTLGVGTVERLIPTVRTSATLGEAISTGLHMDPKTLEEAWRRYLRGQARPTDRT